MIVLHCPFQRDSSRYVCCSRALPLDLSTQELSRQRRRKNALLGDHYFANAKMAHQGCASCNQASDRQFARSQFSSTTSLIFIVLDLKRKAPKRSRADGISFSARHLRGTLALRPDGRGRSELPGRFATADGSITPRRFARRAVGPWLCGKGADARSQATRTPVNRACAGRGTRIRVLRKLLRGDVALARHGGRCEHGSGDQCGR